MGNSSTQLVELMEDVHIAHTFTGNADLSKHDDLRHTCQGVLHKGTIAQLIEPGVVKLLEPAPFWSRDYLAININETEWKLVPGMKADLQ